MRNYLVLPFLVFTVICVTSCVQKTSEPIESSCGDGTVDWERGEECDGYDLKQQTCASVGYYNHLGVLRCGPDCRFDVSDCGGTCGDGVADVAHGEACDGEDFGGQTCQSMDRGDGVLRCFWNCALQILCEGRCGNGLREDSDACEDGNLEAGDGCSPTCEVEVGWQCAPYQDMSRCWVDCGDGLAFGEEECDQDDLRGQTCESLGFSGGTLDCTFFTCEYNVRDCVE